MTTMFLSDVHHGSTPPAFDLSDAAIALLPGDEVEADRLAAHYDALRDPPEPPRFAPCGACAGSYLLSRLDRAGDPIATVLGIAFWALVSAAIAAPLE